MTPVNKSFYPQRIITYGLRTAFMELKHHFKVSVESVSENSQPTNFKRESILFAIQSFVS